MAKKCNRRIVIILKLFEYWLERRAIDYSGLCMYMYSEMDRAKTAIHKIDNIL